MPVYYEKMDLRKFDLVISDTASWGKGVITKPDQLHISYIHTPPRFLYNYSVESTKRNKWYFRPFVSVIDSFLRLWDYSAAQRPDYLISNSHEVQKRVKKFYRRDSIVIFPPSEITTDTFSKDEDSFNPKANTTGNIIEPYFLMIGRLVAYKNFDYVVKAFNELNFKLVVVGSGNEEKSIKNCALQNTVFTGKVSESKKHELIENCLGSINPVEDEDFGIVPIEAMSHGKPVLAHKSGGHMDTIVDGITGMLITSLEKEDLKNSINDFHQKILTGYYDKEKIIEHTQKFSKERFKQEISDFVNDKWNNFKKKQ
jgi:glycosyltransferase involved in cell wall biosynthesis